MLLQIVSVLLSDAAETDKEHRSVGLYVHYYSFQQL